MKRIFCLLAFFFCAFLVFDVSAQGEYAMEKGLSFLEFNYMIMQSYDFYELFKRYGCNMQFGGCLLYTSPWPVFFSKAGRGYSSLTGEHLPGASR